MKIAITGGAGFIGSHLTKYYLDAGHDVLVIDSLIGGSKQAIDARARFYHLDIRDSRLQSILQLERPDIVSHHAAYRRGQQSEHVLDDADVHIRGLLNVLDSSVNAGVRKIIFASGGNSLYGRVARERLPVTEDAPLCPQSAYDISKVAGEWYVRYYTQQYGIKHTILRYADVYGETNGYPYVHPLSYFIRMLQEQRRPVIRGSGEEIHDHIHINDIMQANTCILKRGENRTFHISSGQGCSLRQIYQMVAQKLGSRIEPLHLAGTSAEAPSITLSNRQAQLVLGWHPEGSLHQRFQTALARQCQGQQTHATQTTDELVAVDVSKAAEATLSRV